MATINYFTDLVVWKFSHSLVLEIYRLLQTFPNYEQFALSDQMRRSAVSITSNIAEGFSRKGKKEKQQFYYLSKGSLTELQNQLILSKDLKYLSVDTFSKLFESSMEIHKMLNGLIYSLK